MGRLGVVVSALHVLAVGCIAAFLVSTAHGQITNVANDTITPIEGVGHDYIKMMSETVNPANGGLNIHIDMPVAKSRGLTVPFSITYDSNNVHHLNPGVYNSWGTVGWYANSSLLGQGGWTFALPYARVTSWTENVAVLTGYGSNGPIYTVYDCGNVSNYVMQDLSGVTHALPIGARSGVGDPNNYCGAYSTSPGSDGKVEGFLPAYGGDQFHPPPITANDDVGNVYKYSTFKRDNSIDVNSYAAMPDSIEDRNGNITRFAINPSNGVTVTDTSGRTSISTSGFGPSGSTNNVVVSGETFQVTWRTVSANFSTPSVWAGAPGWPDPVYDICTPPGPANDSQTVISQITLPNGKSYKFYYANDATPHRAATNSYGLVSEIDYPSGAWVTYSWKLSDTLNELADYPGLYYQSCEVCGACNGGPSGCPAPVPHGCVYQYKTPVVAARSVSFGASSPALTQIFTYNTHWPSGKPWDYKTTTVTTTDNITGKSASTTYSYKPIASLIIPGIGRGGQIAVEQSESYSDWNGSPLRTITKDWLDPFDMTLDQTTVTAPGGGGISSKKTYAYITNNTYFKEPQEVDEFDFGASSATRMTVTNYQSFTGANGTIAAAPCQVLICSAGSSCTAASSSKVAETDYLYDNGGAVCAAPGSAATAQVNGLVSGTHDDVNYEYTSSKPRANVTSIIKWLAGGTSPATSYSYDKTGHVISVMDACGNTTCSDMTGTNHTTTYSYADAYTTLSGSSNVSYTPPNGTTNTYLTQVTDPLLHLARFTYDYTNGQLTSSKDQNDITANRAGTTYIYNDFFARPKQVNAADGGQATLAYDDAPYSPSANTPSVTITKVITSSLNEVNISAADGAGHVVRTILNSDPDGADTTDTAYDGLGRVLTQSNPHRSASSPTDGTATYTYDALGRTTSIAQADASVVTTAYDQANGNTLCTTVVDEAGKSRKSCSDGLGRLVQIFEDPAGLNYETDYQYDALGNLLGVSQKGGDSNSANWRPRAFQYDSLSRLTSATNPESGTITYSYDANGNVASRIAPTPNKIAADNKPATVTTTYTYDVLNRLIAKSYNDNPQTPTVQYAYDSGSLTGCATAPPSLTDSNPVGRRTSMCDGSGATSWNHDQMGRVLNEKRTLVGNSNITKTTTYGYNLDGSLASLTYPSTRTITYTPSGSGRPVAAADTAHSINYVSWDCPKTGSYCYAPNGAEIRLIYGAASGFAGIISANSYNARLQPTFLSAGTTSQTDISLGYDFHFGNGDNGNVYQIVNNRDTNRTQNFTYDALNRITSASTQGTTAPNCWGQLFGHMNGGTFVSGIDPWGNLNEITLTQCTAPTLSQTSLANNQISGFCYDYAGNLLSQTAPCPNSTPYYPTYIYDGENRLRSIQQTVVPYYTYDGDGKRVIKTIGTNRLYWTGTGSDTLTETDGSGNPTADYIYFNGKRVARLDNPNGTPSVRYYFSDHLGSAEVITDSQGVIKNESDYLPYGTERVITSGDTNRYKFTGKERDTESGLDMFGKRYYASSLGRFMSTDAKQFTARHLAMPQKWNKYAYVQNNPLASIDPDGLDDYKIFIGDAAVGGNWARAQAVAEAHGHTFQIFRGKDASIENYNKALSGASNRVVFIGHTTHDPTTEKVNAIELGNGRSAGTQSVKQAVTTIASDAPPLVTEVPLPATTINANTVGLFGCNSIDLSSQYSNTSFFGIDSGPNNVTSLEAAGSAASAFVEADAASRPADGNPVLPPQDPVAAANSGLQANQHKEDTDGDRVKKCEPNGQCH